MDVLGVDLQLDGDEYPSWVGFEPSRPFTGASTAYLMQVVRDGQLRFSQRFGIGRLDIGDFGLSAFCGRFAIVRLLWEIQDCPPS
ncbi:hypothetical protein LIER_19108 [Lithospermum erythrorhizon]|uniref:Uncharacterized protein n=1 Tax=Lithospermum erythrorhizon TaxID=34254 RepID=A0AAV3QGI1_LITER